MSRKYSAVQLDAADSQIASGLRAHDMMHDPSLDATRQATQAIRASSLNLESLNADVTLSSHGGLDLHSALQKASPHDGVVAEAAEHHAQPCVTTLAHDSITPVTGGDETHESEQVAPSSFSPSIIRFPTLLGDTTPPVTTPPSLSTATTTVKLSPSAVASQPNPRHAINPLSLLHKSHTGAAGSTNIPYEGNMIAKYPGMGAATSSHRRRQYANTSALTDYEADLTAKDRTKQKEAVKRLLMDKVKDDWKWEWPRPSQESKEQHEAEPEPESQPQLEHNHQSIPTPLESLDSEDVMVEEQWKERDEWISNASDSGEDATAIAAKGIQKLALGTKDNPFRFDSPDGVGETIKKTQGDRKRRRKKRLAEEMAWNDGVRCFTERRDAWTGARRVSHSTSHYLGLSPVPTKQLQKSTSNSSEDEGSSTAIDHETSDIEEDWEADIEIPIAPPLIPPTNAMRASINPTAYNTIYDKVILQNLTPSCPINLKDITRTCVQGWKRDGEWPPKSSVPENLAGKRRRRLSMASLFGLEKTWSKEEREKAAQEKVENADRSSGDAKSNALKRGFQRLLSLGGKDKEHGKEHAKEHGKEHNNSLNGNGKAKETEATTQA